MKKIILLLVLFLMLKSKSYSQEKEKINPIIFAEMMFGYSVGSSQGFTGVGTLNYQKQSNLFTYRYLELSKYRRDGSVLFIPIYTEIEHLREQALMYGKRIINKNVSYSYSAGIAYIDRDFLVDEMDGVLKYDNEKSVGLPFEVNIKWFKSKKERYRIYGLIPVGKPTSFGNSIGFKLYGDISKTSFIGLGLTIGLGWHKIY